jgi:hypothetical protein
MWVIADRPYRGEEAMRSYRVRWDYEARDWNGHPIKLRKDEIVQLDEGVATWVLADSPGILHELGGAQKARLIEEPGEDRMLKQASGKR